MKKKILITGENGYIGNNLGNFLNEQNEFYEISFISLKNSSWKNHNFDKYDVIIHLAAIVHRKETQKNKEIYEIVNYRLTKELSEVAYKSKVKHFIYMSTMAVYGVDAAINKSIILNKETPTNPTTYYGKSKLKAEKFLEKISSNEFIVTIIRTPMVYGENCPGNYKALEKVASILPVFPKIDNEKSAVHINKLSSDILKIIKSPKQETVVIQDDFYMNTSQAVKNIAVLKNRNIYLSKKLGRIIIFFGSKNKMINKIFGNMIYK